MKLNNFIDLVFKELNRGKKTPSQLARSLGVTRQNITMWKSSGVIPDKHFQILVRELSIPKELAIRALKKDIKENFK